MIRSCEAVYFARVENHMRTLAQPDFACDWEIPWDCISATSAQHDAVFGFQHSLSRNESETGNLSFCYFRNGISPKCRSNQTGRAKITITARRSHVQDR